MNAAPAAYVGAKPFPALHLPTGRRVTVELLLRHLIVEHGIEPISPRWQDVLAESEAHFREIQRKRFQPE